MTRRLIAELNRTVESTNGKGGSQDSAVRAAAFAPEMLAVLKDYIALADAVNAAKSHDLLKAAPVERIKANQAKARELIVAIEGVTR